MMSLLATGTYFPFEIPPDKHDDRYHHYINSRNANAYLNAVHIIDHFLEKIISGFKSRKMFNETLFVIVGDHGHAFHDYGENMLGTRKVPLEIAFLVPMMFYNPHLEDKQLDGQFTNMDVLPIIVDILLSSRSSPQSTNLLLSGVNNQLQSILFRYEGTSLVRMPLDQQSIGYTFHLPCPGSSYIIVKQYPRKLTYNIAKDEAHLYHLKYDPFELTDLIVLDHNTKAIYPLWIDVMRDKNSTRTWKGHQINGNIAPHYQMLFQNKRFVLNSELNTKNNTLVGMPKKSRVYSIPRWIHKMH